VGVKGLGDALVAVVFLVEVLIGHLFKQ
jgi:hypothetical protein